jgi:hypothetical protein
MEILEDADITLQIARLVEIIYRDNNALQRHKEAGSPTTIVEQYEELRAEHLEELRLLMAQMGLKVELTPLQNAA